MESDGEDGELGNTRCLRHRNLVGINSLGYPSRVLVVREDFFSSLGIQNLPLIATIALVSLFNILIHLGVASATALASALIPVFIASAMSISGLPEQGIGFVLIQQFVISFGFLLPISAPQNMLAYGTGAFTARQFLKNSIPLTAAGYGLILIFLQPTGVGSD